MAALSSAAEEISKLGLSADAETSAESVDASSASTFASESAAASSSEAKSASVVESESASEAAAGPVYSMLDDVEAAADKVRNELFPDE